MWCLRKPWRTSRSIGHQARDEQEGVSQEGEEAELQIRNRLQQEPDGVQDGKDQSHNEQTHLPCSGVLRPGSLKKITFKFSI